MPCAGRDSPAADELARHNMPHIRTFNKYSARLHLITHTTLLLIQRIQRIIWRVLERRSVKHEAALNFTQSEVRGKRGFENVLNSKILIPDLNFKNVCSLSNFNIVAEVIRMIRGT